MITCTPLLLLLLLLLLLILLRGRVSATTSHLLCSPKEILSQHFSFFSIQVQATNPVVFPPTMAALEKAGSEPHRTPRKHQHTLPPLVQLAHRVEDVIDDINWLHVAFRLFAAIYIAFILWITFLILPFPGHWRRSTQSDKLPT